MMPRLFMAVAQAPWSVTGTLRWFCSGPRLPAPSAAAPQTNPQHQKGGAATAGTVCGVIRSLPLAIAVRLVSPGTAVLSSD